MALTLTVTDGDAINAAKANQFVATPSKQGVLLDYGRVYYTGSAWAIDASHDSYGLSSPVFGSNTLTLTLSNLAAAPIAIAVQSLQASTVYLVRTHTPSSSVLQIRFYTTSGVLVTTPDTSMDVYVQVIGA